MRLATKTGYACLGLMLIGLGGCGVDRSSPTTEQRLPPPPADLEQCARARAALPPGPWTEGQVQSIIAQLTASEERKSDCINRFLAFYQTLPGRRR